MEVMILGLMVRAEQDHGDEQDPAEEILRERMERGKARRELPRCLKEAFEKITESTPKNRGNNGLLPSWFSRPPSFSLLRVLVSPLPSDLYNCIELYSIPEPLLPEGLLCHTLVESRCVDSLSTLCQVTSTQKVTVTFCS